MSRGRVLLHGGRVLKRAGRLESLPGHFFLEHLVALALALGGLVKGAAFPEGEAGHAVRGDLVEDRIDAVLFIAPYTYAYLILAH